MNTSLSPEMINLFRQTIELLELEMEPLINIAMSPVSNEEYEANAEKLREYESTWKSLHLMIGDTRFQFKPKPATEPAYQLAERYLDINSEI